MRRLAVAAVALSLVAAPVAASGPPPTPAGDECRERGGTERMCSSIDAALNAATAWCREAAGLPAEECATPSGRIVRSELVDAYLETWTHRTHALQRSLGDGLPLRDALWIGTHNTYNAAAYFPTLSGSDPNQQYSIYDQLRMDVRAIELDVHWFPRAQDGGFAPVLCHATGPHLGCTYERHLADGLAEVAAWLEDNPGEVLVVRFETHLDGAQGYDAAAALVEEHLGDRAYKRDGDGCARLPVDLSRDEVRAAGKQVVLTGDCGAGSAWPALVYDYQRVERRPRAFAPYPACDGDRSVYASSFVRYYEDGTWLTVMAGTPDDGISPATAREMLRCGVNQVDFDHLVPDDGRLDATVWSWAADEPAAGGAACAEHGADARFRALDCAEERVFVCAVDGGWAVTAASGPWSAGPDACAGELGPGASFATPRSGYENELVREAKTAAGADLAWLAYADLGAGWAVSSSA